VPFDSGTDIDWRSRAVRLDDEQEATLTVTATEISFGGLLRRWRVSREAVVELRAEGLELTFVLPEEEVAFSVEPVQLIAHLRSGARDLTLTAEDLVRRMTYTEGPNFSE
jgi:hypothetical protein